MFLVAVRQKPRGGGSALPKVSNPLAKFQGEGRSRGEDRTGKMEKRKGEGRKERKRGNGKDNRAHGFQNLDTPTLKIRLVNCQKYVPDLTVQVGRCTCTPRHACLLLVHCVIRKIITAVKLMHRGPLLHEPLAFTRLSQLASIISTPEFLLLDFSEIRPNWPIVDSTYPCNICTNATRLNVRWCCDISIIFTD